MPSLFLQSNLYGADHFTPDDQNVRETQAFPVGDMEEGFLELTEQDTEQGILSSWHPPKGAVISQMLVPFAEEIPSPFFPRDELRAYWNLCEERVPLDFLLETASRQQRVVARIEMSARLERVLDPSKVLTAWMALSRRARSRALSIPCFPPCVARGIDLAERAGEPVSWLTNTNAGA